MIERSVFFIMLKVCAIQDNPPKGRTHSTKKGAWFPRSPMPPVISSRHPIHPVNKLERVWLKQSNFEINDGRINKRLKKII